MYLARFNWLMLSLVVLPFLIGFSPLLFILNIDAKALIDKWFWLGIELTRPEPKIIHNENTATFRVGEE